MDQEKEKKSKNKPIMPVSISYIKKLIQLAKENQISCLEVANVKIVNGLIEVAAPVAIPGVPVATVEDPEMQKLREATDPTLTPEQFEAYFWSSTPDTPPPKLRQVK